MVLPRVGSDGFQRRVTFLLSSSGKKVVPPVFDQRWQSRLSHLSFCGWPASRLLTFTGFPFRLASQAWLRCRL